MSALVYAPGVTAVSSKSIVNVSVADAVDVKPTPPAISTVLFVSIACELPKSPTKFQLVYSVGIDGNVIKLP